MSASTFHDGRVTLHAGDCLDVLDAIPENSVDSACTDPPYHLTSIVKRFGAEGAVPAGEGADGAFRRVGGGFMGKQWDGGDIAFKPETWAKVLRVLKPGAYIVAFSSSRTFGRMSVALEDAGFITHPLIGNILSQGEMVRLFLDSLSPEQQAAFARILDANDLGGMLAWVFAQGFPKATRIRAEGYDGFRYGGQSLKPALEPIYVGQKPFSEPNGTANILRWGTGAININGCRVANNGEAVPVFDTAGGRKFEQSHTQGTRKTSQVGSSLIGRWPANLILSDDAEVIDAFPSAPGQQRSVGPQHGAKKTVNTFGDYGAREQTDPRGDSGSAARFFFQAKADAEDRAGSRHPTVKPLDLMRYLVRLVTPPRGLVLDPFAGTGTTGHAALIEGMRAVLIEREAEYQVDIARRMELVFAGPDEKARKLAKAEAYEGMPLFGGAA